VVEEADETVFWLELLSDSGLIKSDRLVELLTEAREITAIFTPAYSTSRSNSRSGF
jgi:four helix bundle protein